MPYTSATYEETTADQDIGTLTVIFTDVDDTTFVFSRRLLTTDAGQRTAFKSAADAAVADWQAQKSRVAAKEATVLAFMNA